MLLQRRWVTIDFIKTIIEKLKINELFSIIFIAAISVTFMPIGLLQKLHIENLRIKYQSYISICIIIIGSYYTFGMISWVINKIRRKFDNPRRTAIQYMKKFMSADEMGFLIENYYDEINHRFKSTAMIECTDGRKTGLENKYILYSASNMGYCYEFAYNLQPFAQKFLNRNLANGNIDIQSNQFRYKLR